jgi:hypothetical protein
MTSIRRLASALCLATFCSFSNAQQIDSTGNLINDGAWSGIGAYAPDPNDCCSNPSGSFPLYDTSTNTIKWSYSTVNVTQTIGIQSALSSLGMGLVVQGYNYSFDAKNLSENGAGYDTFGYNTWLTNSSGQVLLSQGSNLTTPFNWTTFSGNLSLNTPLPLPESGVVGISFYGRDDGFWAGLYGPEVRNVSLSLNYSFDPCASDPLYSSSCPGYLEAYMANLFAMLGWSSTPEPEVEVATVSPTVTTTTTSATTPEETTTGEVKVDAGGVEISTTGELSVPDGIPEVVKEDKKEKKEVDRNLIANIIREATDDSKALAIVNQSIEQSLSDNANPDFSMTNETLASISRQRESSIQQSILESQESSQSSSSVSSASQNAQNEQNVTYETQNENTSATSEFQNQPLPKIANENQKETTQTVKKNVQDNEAAGEVSIDSLAQAPIDFNQYLNQQLKDMAFYAPKEIYKGQRNVDNARLLRGLTGGSDRLHQEMVNQQYR